MATFFNILLAIYATKYLAGTLIFALSPGEFKLATVEFYFLAYLLHASLEDYC